MDEVVTELLESTGALGVWLFGRAIVGDDNQLRNAVLAAAVRDASIEPPVKLQIEGETYLDFVDRQIFAQPIGGVTLVIVFDDRSSYGLIRLRVRHAKDAIVRAVATRRG